MSVVSAEELILERQEVRLMSEEMDLLDLNLDDEFNEEELKKESEELLEMRFLTKENATFARTEGGFVSLKFGDKEYKRIGVYLTFPLTKSENTEERLQSPAKKIPVQREALKKTYSFSKT